MQSLFQICVQELKQQPSKLNIVTDKLLKDAAKYHHPHNRLLPASFIQMLLGEIHPQNIFDTNIAAHRYILAINLLRNIIIANFSQLYENKMFTGIILNFSLTINKLLEKIRQNSTESLESALKLIARGTMISQIMLKVLQKSHIFLPQLLRFYNLCLDICYSYFKEITDLPQIQTTKIEQKTYSKLAVNSKLSKIFFALSFRKSWKDTHTFYLIKRILQQLHNYSVICGSKNIDQLDIYKSIKEKLNLFKTLINSEQREMLINLQQNQPIPTQQIYLQAPIQVRQLTPRFYNEQQAVILSKLRKKKHKLTKKIETQLRKGVIVKQQQAHIVDEVRRQKGQRQQKKEQLIIQKQTVQVKRHNRQVKKIKLIKKANKSSKGIKGSNLQNIKGKGKK